MPTYEIAQMTITAGDQYRKYGRAVVPLITNHGGSILDTAM